MYISAKVGQISVPLLLFLCALFSGCIRERINLKNWTAAEIAHKFTLEELLTLNSIRDSTEQTRYKFEDKSVKLNAPPDSISLALEQVIFAVHNCFDDRKDIYQIKNPNIEMNSARVMTILNSERLDSVLKNEFVYSWTPKKWTHRGGRPLCNSGSYTEPFFGQPMSGEGTAFAIDSNIIVTSGHNIPGCGVKNPPFTIENLAFIFDFKMTSKTTANLTFTHDQIYRPIKCLYCESDQNGVDLALLQTGRKIPKHRVVKLSNKSKIDDCDSIYSIGHPLKLPMKVANNAFVYDNTNPNFFTSSIDVFGSNSGSPVFNAKTHLLVGFISNGSDLDYGRVYRNGTSCEFTKVCTNHTTCPSMSEDLNEPLNAIPGSLCENQQARGVCFIPQVLRTSVILDAIKKSGINNEDLN